MKKEKGIYVIINGYTAYKIEKHATGIRLVDYKNKFDDFGPTTNDALFREYLFDNIIDRGYQWSGSVQLLWDNAKMYIAPHRNNNKKNQRNRHQPVPNYRRQRQK